MLEFGRPGFVLAGVLAATLPVVLHLIARQPPRRVAFPTARFLRPEPRLAVRLRRWPTDLLLLCLRSSWLLLLGLALAAPSWSPRRVGTVEIVLLDRGAGMAGWWGAAVDSVGRAVLAEGAGRSRELVLFDTVADHIPAPRLSAAFLDSLALAGPGGAAVDYAVALRALAEVARARADADSFRVTLVTRPRWEGWSPGFGSLRAAVWPGGIRLAPTEAAVGESVGASTRGGIAAAPPDLLVARVLRGTGAEVETRSDLPYAEAALEALGWKVAGGAGAGGEVGEEAAAAALIVLSPLAAGEQAAIMERVREGTTVVTAGALPAGALRAASPWEWPETGDVAPAGALVLAGGPVIGGVAQRFPGRPRPGARLLAAWEDGRPAAAAVREGAGCLVYLATGLKDGELPLMPSFPELLDQLLQGCVVEPAAVIDDRPLDYGARRVLAGPEQPASAATTGAAAAALAPGSARVLGGWFLLAALGVALAETWLAYRRRGW
jgi:hypothetical protein